MVKDTKKNYPFASFLVNPSQLWRKTVLYVPSRLCTPFAYEFSYDFRVNWRYSMLIWQLIHSHHEMTFNKLSKETFSTRNSFYLLMACNINGHSICINLVPVCHCHYNNKSNHPTHARIHNGNWVKYISDTKSPWSGQCGSIEKNIQHYATRTVTNQSWTQEIT